MPGLLWKTEYVKEPVAYGIFKLIIASTIEDDLVSTDICIEEIEAIKGMVDQDSDEEEEEEDEEEGVEAAAKVEATGPREKVEGFLAQSVEIKAFSKI
jgi:hypothetical protein